MSVCFKLDRYNDQLEIWPIQGRHILAQYDDQSIIVYGTVFGRGPNAFYKAPEPEVQDHTFKNAGGSFAESTGKEVGIIKGKADGIRNNKVHKVSGKHKTEDDMNVKNNGEAATEIDDFVWLQTSFVKKMYSCKWGQRSHHERILALSIKREGFDEILRTYVNDVQNNRESGEVLLEWYPDRSLTGEAMERLVPDIRLSGAILQQFYDKWVLGIKDVSEYVGHQRRFVNTGRLNLVSTPQEMTYMPECTDVCDVLGITDESETVLKDNESEDKEPFTVTLAEAFSRVNPIDITVSSDQPREAILFLYGAFNPIHLGHVTALVESKQWLENEAKYHVCDTKIAIASDDNIKEKFAKSHDLCIKFEHRLKLCELACVNHPWITVSSIPARSQQSCGEEIRNELNKPDATLVVLMGSDRALLSPVRVGNARKENKFILCIGRKGMNANARKSFEEAKKNDPERSLEFFVVPTEINDISSTAIRQKLGMMRERKKDSPSKIAKDLCIVKEMIDSNWITEEEGEYIFQNCDSLYFKK